MLQFSWLCLILGGDEDGTQIQIIEEISLLFYTKMRKKSKLIIVKRSMFMLQVI